MHFQINIIFEGTLTVQKLKYNAIETFLFLKKVSHTFRMRKTKEIICFQKAANFLRA